MRIDQWVPALHRGDAIGDSARLDARRVPALGPRGRRVRAGARRRTSRATAGPGREWTPGGPADVVILHYALPSPLTARPARAPRPPRAAPPQHHAAGVLRRLRPRDGPHLRGRAARSSARWRGRWTWPWRDSEFNRRELEAAGFPRTGVLPIYLDFERYREPPNPRAAPRCWATAAPTCSSWAASRPTSARRTSSAWPRTGSGSSRRTCGCCWWASCRGAATTSTRSRRSCTRRASRPGRSCCTGHVDHDDLLACYARGARVRLA